MQGGGGKKAWSSEETYQEFSAAAKRLRATIDKVSEPGGVQSHGCLARG